MKLFLLVVMLGCAMIWHPATVLLAALFVYVTHRIGAAFKRRVSPAAAARPLPFVAPPTQLERRFSIISGGRP